LNYQFAHKILRDAVFATDPETMSLIITDREIEDFCTDCIAQCFDPDDLDATEEAIFDAVSTGNTRTMQQDVSFGLRQMADVGLKALSPGINDPTTAQDSIFRWR